MRCYVGGAVCLGLGGVGVLGDILVWEFRVHDGSGSREILGYRTQWHWRKPGGYTPPIRSLVRFNR